ncbi:MAG: rhodanese-like domain-containing protein [Actinobacteria bacterium]|nr:MAG: rhodanese-like domain-containing protein [Actinomycetota bacterium]
MPSRIELPGLDRLIESGAQVVDVLPEAEFAESHLPGAISIPLKSLDAATAAVLDRRRSIVVYCHDYL